MAQNQLTGTISYSLGNLRNLESFLVPKNQLEGEIPSSVGDLSNLLDFNIGCLCFPSLFVVFSKTQWPLPSRYQIMP